AARLRRRSGLLRLWRLLCASIGSNAVGPPLAANQSLLLSSIIEPSTSKAPGPVGRGFLVGGDEWNRRLPSWEFAHKLCNRWGTGNKLSPSDLSKHLAWR